MDIFSRLRGVSTYRGAADGDTREVLGNDKFSCIPSQIGEIAALDDAKKCLLWGATGLFILPLSDRPDEPAVGAVGCIYCVTVIGAGGDRMVKSHNDIRTDIHLGPGGGFRGEKVC